MPAGQAVRVRLFLRQPGARAPRGPELAGSGVKVGYRRGLPFAPLSALIKALETREAIAADRRDRHGDHIGAAKEGDYETVRRGESKPCSGRRPQTAQGSSGDRLLSDEQIVLSAGSRADLGAAFVKTSSGFAPRGQRRARAPDAPVRSARAWAEGLRRDPYREFASSSGRGRSQPGGNEQGCWSW